MGLIPEADLQHSREKYFAANPTPAMICVRTLKTNPDMTTAELALIVSRSRSWVRKVLKAAGIKAALTKRRKEA